MIRPNILIDPLPESVEIGGEEIPIRTGFRTGILFETMVTSGALPEDETRAQALVLWYPEESLLRIAELRKGAEALEAALRFFRLGRDEPKRGQGHASLARRIYDFDEDAERIYAAFLSQYRIDLTVAELHWWQFSALFAGLHESEEIVKIMGYRAAELGKIKNKEERRRMARLQALYALPDNRTTAEKVAAAGAAFFVR